jgi:hypothetical protein
MIKIFIHTIKTLVFIKCGIMHRRREREQLIRDLGYNLVVIWEYDWKRLNILIKILQRKFRSNR